MLRLLRIRDRIAHELAKRGCSANALTIASIVLCAGAGVLFATHLLVLGGLLFLAGGLGDALDGAVARAHGRASRRGAFLDSICDRYAELIVFAGLAIHAAGPLELGVTLAALGGSFMTSYARARGEGLGVTKMADVGLLQRPHRFALIGGAALLGSDLVLFLALTAVALLANVTAVSRLRHVRMRLDPSVSSPPR